MRYCIFISCLLCRKRLNFVDEPSFARRLLVGSSVGLDHSSFVFLWVTYQPQHDTSSSHHKDEESNHNESTMLIMPLRSSTVASFRRIIGARGSNSRALHVVASRPSDPFAPTVITCGRVVPPVQASWGNHGRNAPQRQPTLSFEPR
jgi:hypothetical protein